MHVLRLVLIGIAIGVAIVLGVRFIGNPFGGRAPVATTAPAPAPAPATNAVAPPPAAPKPLMSAEAARNAFDEKLGAASEFAAFFEGFRQNFPSDYERVVERLVERTRMSPQNQNADIYLAEALRSMRRTHGVLASRASVEQIERVFDRQAGVMQELAKTNPKLCADFLYGAASPGFFAFSASHRQLIAGMAEAGLEAIIDGKSKDIDRQPPSDADFALFETGLQNKGLSKTEIDALLDGKAPDPPLSDAAMCRAGSIYYETLRHLPEESRLRIYALAIKLLART